jgi:RimJ/RimL family protein N-acetyltransferase
VLDETLIDAGIATIRRFRAEDLEPLLVLADDAGVAANMRDIFPHPYTRADGEEWIARATGDLTDTAFAIEVDGKFAGGVGVAQYKNEERITAEIGYWLGRPFWGRGIATAVVGALVPWVFEHLPDVLRLQACTYSSNPASGRVLEKNGFKFEGVMRRSVTKGDRILDQNIFALLRET